MVNYCSLSKWMYEIVQYLLALHTSKYESNMAKKDILDVATTMIYHAISSKR